MLSNKEIIQKSNIPGSLSSAAVIPVAVERSLLESSAGVGCRTVIIVDNAVWMAAGPRLNSALRKAPNDFLKLERNIFFILLLIFLYLY